MDTLYEVVSAAIADLAEHGYDNAERVAGWERKIKEAADRTMVAPHFMEQMLREALVAVYRRMVDRGEIAKLHPGIGRFTLEKVRPYMRAELDRRILASANLIRLNRQQAVAQTLQRFSGWATSIPKGGTDKADRRKVGKDVRKALTSLPFQERRVLIDQGHKLTAAISEVMAKDGAAIAGRWRSNWRQKNYDYRPEHKERDGNVYAVRGCWAIEQGLMKKGEAGYYDEVTAVAEEPFCRCYMVWLYNLGSLPADMLTRKGEERLAQAKREAA
jgi:hypothetical protein